MYSIHRLFICTGICMLFAFNSLAQDGIRLKSMETHNGIPEGKAVIYGTFIQRLGFSSGGFPQYISIVNMDTKKAYSFNVKPTFKSSRKNIFCYALQPGTYVIMNYQWTESKWYGGTMNTDPIFKQLPPEDKALGHTIKGRLLFKVAANTLYYTGTWHFDKLPPSFSDDGKELDPKLRKHYPQFDFSTAITVLPQ